MSSNLHQQQYNLFNNPFPTKLTTNNIKLLTIKIHLKHTNLHISNVNNTNNIDNTITNLFIRLTCLPNSIITGDFNAHSHSWHSPFTDHRDQLITSLILNSNHIILNQNTPIRLPSTQINNPPPPTSLQQTPQYQPTSLGKHLKL